jgi:hypothetical protein
MKKANLLAQNTRALIPWSPITKLPTWTACLEPNQKIAALKPEDPPNPGTSFAGQLIFG